MLDRLSPNPGSRKPRQRKGRGIGSGHGRTCGRGQKGAGARSGSKKRAWLEGGQMPLSRRLPKFGFTSMRPSVQIVNVRDLKKFEKDSLVNAASLAEAGLVSHADRPVKVLAKGDLEVALKLEVAAISESARKKVEGAGGSVELDAKPERGPKKKAKE